MRSLCMVVSREKHAEQELERVQILENEDKRNHIEIDPRMRSEIRFLKIQTKLKWMRRSLQHVGMGESLKGKACLELR